jgi:hypothetical protein
MPSNLKGPATLNAILNAQHPHSPLIWILVGAARKRVGVNWMSCVRMSTSKASGGMGFREFTCFYKALSTKQSWRP